MLHLLADSISFVVCCHWPEDSLGIYIIADAWILEAKTYRGSCAPDVLGLLLISPKLGLRAHLSKSLKVPW